MECNNVEILTGPLGKSQFIIYGTCILSSEDSECIYRAHFPIHGEQFLKAKRTVKALEDF